MTEPNEGNPPTVRKRSAKKGANGRSRVKENPKRTVQSRSFSEGDTSPTFAAIAFDLSKPTIITDLITPVQSVDDEENAPISSVKNGIDQKLLPSPILERSPFAFEDEDGDDCEILTDDEEEEEEDDVDARVKKEPRDSESEASNEVRSQDNDSNSGKGKISTPATSPSRERRTLKLAFATLSPGRQKPKQGVSEARATEVKRLGVRGATSELLSPLTPIRTKIMAMGKKATRKPPEASVNANEIDSDHDQDRDQLGDDGQASDGYSSGGSSYSDDSESESDDSREYYIDDGGDQVTDFNALPYLPSSFLDVPPESGYLDHDLLKNISNQDIPLFSREHHLLVKGLVQLLAERDHIGVEGNVNDSSNILKMGPLKKKSTQLWFVKYVEIRKGNLSYYEDSNKEGHQSRKTVHLRKHTCRCQALTKDASSGSYVFELVVEGGHKRLWMAKSDEERQAWIRAINQAMIGETEDSTYVPLDLDLYKSAIDVYESVQFSLQQVQTINEYLIAVDTLFYRQKTSAALRVPLQWVREQVIQVDVGRQKRTNPQKRVKSNVNEFWKTLSNTPISINGHFVEAGTAYSAERVVGALTRCILEFDRCEAVENRTGLGLGPLEMIGPVHKRSGDHTFMTEVEAISYARSILMAILRSHSRGDAFSTIGNLCRNDDVVSVSREASEPLHIDVSFAGDDFSEYELKSNDATGWVLTKTKKNKIWKERFFVISEGVLSHYENADPRPHGLRGQLVLGGATLNTLDLNILQIQTKDQERQLRFEDPREFVKWKNIISHAIDPSGATEFSPPMLNPDSPGPSHRKRASIVDAGVKLSKDATEAGVKLLKGATGGGLKAIKGATGGGMKYFKEAKQAASGLIARGIGLTPKDGGHHDEGSIRRRPKLDMLMTSTRNIQGVNEKREQAVQVVVELTSIYKVLSETSDGPKETIL
jgi:hypothetical protein